MAMNFGTPRMQLEDWLDDLCVRFIINLPEADLSSVARICFQVEEAQWFYEDFIRPLDPNLPSMSLRTFCLRIFQHCPLLAHFSVENHTKAFEEFLEYKTRVPVRGAILMNHALDSIVLVKGWKKGANWTFPGGKINKDEDDLDCAIREVWEETGLDLRAAGLVSKDAKPKYIEIPIRSHQVRLYVFRDVPMNTHFEPQTRKEISRIEWYKFSELPTFRRKNGPNINEPAGASNPNNKFYMVAPFMVPLKKWIASQKKFDEKKINYGPSASSGYLHPGMPIEEIPSDSDAFVPASASQAVDVPAADTLDSATQELQRLLKMQPPTQGVQLVQPVQSVQPIQPIQPIQPEVSIDDKGSALLSILQARGPQRDVHLMENQAQHVPVLHNQQLPPVSLDSKPRHLPIPPYEPSLPGFSQHDHQEFSSENLQQNHTDLRNSTHSYEHRNPLQMPNEQRPTFPAFHPQMSQMSQLQQVFADQPQRLPQSRLPFQNPPDIAPQHDGSQGQLPNYYPNSRPTQATDSLYPESAQLNTQSQALLNAFKRDDTTPTSINKTYGHVPMGQPPAGIAQYGKMPNASPRQLDAQLPQRHIEHPPTQPLVHQRSPSELAGFPAASTGDQHKSTLLGMFKQATPERRGPVAIPPTTQRLPIAGSNDRMVGQFPSSEKWLNQAVSQPLQTLERQMEHLSLPSHPNLRDVRQPVGNPAHVAPLTGNTHSPSSMGSAIRPVQILTRESNSQRERSPAANVYHGRPSELRAPSSQRASMTTSPEGPIVAAGRKPVGNEQQQRQLLSLFGPRQSPSAGAPLTDSPGSQAPFDGRRGQVPYTQSPTSGEAVSGAGGPHARRDKEAAMSPADQSFLLGYLQSVTTNASK